MADRKITELASLAVPVGVDLLYIVDDPTGTPLSKKISLNTFFASVPANTAISGTLSATGNTAFNGTRNDFSEGKISLRVPTSVASNNATTVLGRADGRGTIFWDDNFLYVATSNTQIKRVSLSTF